MAYTKYFTSFELTESPPIETPEYKDTKDFYTTISSSPESLQNYILDDSFYIDNPFTQQKTQQRASENSTTYTNFESTYDFRSMDSHASKSSIVQYFRNKGLTEEQARGIYGNIMQESGGNLNAHSKDGHSSYGLAQWTGERKTRLFKMYGKHPTQQQQLDFLWWELNNTHKSALLALKQTNTVADATKVFMDKFEKPHKDYANLARRQRFAMSARCGGILKAQDGTQLSYQDSDPEIVKRYVTLLNRGVPAQAAFDASHMSIIEKGQKGYYAFGKYRNNIEDWGKAAADSLTTGLYKNARDSANFKDYIQKVKSKGYNNRPQFWNVELPKGRNVDKQRVNSYNKRMGLPLIAQINNTLNQNYV